ncbi:MAG TPA: hypothetical protein VFM82_09135 [Flavobacteriaceae bacterium]|nr:hypothetical protein [Flavobacteriaceae bacterium]
MNRIGKFFDKAPNPPLHKSGRFNEHLKGREVQIGSYTILTDRIFQIGTDSTNVYSFKIQKTDSLAIDFKNFVIYERSDGSFTFYIYHFQPVEDPELDFPFVPEISEVDANLVDISDFGVSARDLPCGIGFSELVPVYGLYCDCCDGSCNTHDPYSTILGWEWEWNANSCGPSGSGGGGPGGSGSGGGDGGDNEDNDPPNNDSGHDLPGVVPINSDDGPTMEPEDIQNCNELGKISTDLDVRLALNDLKDDFDYGTDHETGYTFNHNSFLNPISQAFSVQDIAILFKIANTYNNGTPDYSIPVMILVSGQKAYALKINDFSKFSQLQDEFEDEIKYKTLTENLGDEFDRRTSGYNDSAKSYQELFLEYLQKKDMGLSLFAADKSDLEYINNGTSMENQPIHWKKLSLEGPPNNNEVVETPCN